MQNSPCANNNKSSTPSPCAHGNATTTTKRESRNGRSKEIRVLQPECLIVNIESVQQVSIHNPSSSAERPKKICRANNAQRPMTATPAMNSQKCVMPIEEYRKLVEMAQRGNPTSKSNSSSKPKLPEWKNQSKPKNAVRPKTEPDSAVCVLTCEDYRKLMGKSAQESKCNKQQKKEVKNQPKNEIEALEDDRWITTYQSTFTWK
jgi:hypothetical protein